MQPVPCGLLGTRPVSGDTAPIPHRYRTDIACRSWADAPSDLDPLWPTLIMPFLTVTSLGFVLGNATARASAEVRDIAGTGSAPLGAVQLVLGAVVSPLVRSSPILMAPIIVAAAVPAFAALSTLARREPAPAR